MSLAAKLPYNHAYAGGFPGLGAQPLPQDADCLDYLGRMAAADGAGVEVSVANAVDAFISGAKDAGVWDSIRASCVLAGARTLAGALVPLRNEGPELWDGTVTPVIWDSGSVGSWDPSTQTAASETISSNDTFPRFQFELGLSDGKEYRVKARLTTAVTGSVRYVRLGYQTLISPLDEVNNVIEVDTTATASGTPSSIFEIDLDGSIPGSAVTIESLSIREVIAAPTNVANGFVEGDYDRQNGLTGDGATTYLDSGRAGDDDLQNDRHRAMYVTVTPSLTPKAYMGHANGPDQFDDIYHASNGFSYIRSLTSGPAYSGANETGFIGYSRTSSATVDFEVFSSSATDVPHSSVTPLASNALVFGSNEPGGPGRFTDATISFYSIGTSVPLEDLDTSVTDLMNRIRFALVTGENPAGLDPATIDYVLRGYDAGGTLA